jgi:hypothetical protein
VSVVVNGPPQPGTFSVFPTSGWELRTMFTLSAANWTDMDLPLTYRFGFVSPSTGLDLTVIDRSISSSGLSIFPAGNALQNHSLTCTFEVFDSTDRSYLGTHSLTVYPVSIDEMVAFMSGADSAAAGQAIAAACERDEEFGWFLLLLVELISPTDRRPSANGRHITEDLTWRG